MKCVGLGHGPSEGDDWGCLQCGHVPDALGPWLPKYPITCMCRCHDWVSRTPPRVHPEVAGFRSTISALQDLATNWLPNTFDDPDNYARTVEAHRLVDRALRYLSGELELPGETLREEFPPFPYSLRREEEEDN